MGVGGAGERWCVCGEGGIVVAGWVSVRLRKDGGLDGLGEGVCGRGPRW